MTPGYNPTESTKITEQRNATYIWPFASCGGFRRVNGFPHCPEDTEHFQPEQKLLLQELVQNRCDVDRDRTNQVLVPRLAGIFQRLANVFLGPFLQVNDLRVDDPIWELAHVSFQLSVHRPQTPAEKFHVLVRGTNPEPLIGASGWIDDEVRK